MIHEMNLCPAPFARIKKGKKDIEMRLNEEKRKCIKKGDEIRFRNLETGEILLCEVISLTPFKDFEEVYAHYPKKRLGYKWWELASYKDMEKYYPEERIKEHGALAIEIRLKK